MRRVISLIIIFILILSAVTLTRNIWDSYSKLEGLNEIKKKERSLSEENENLKKELSVRQSKEFVEKEARDKLGLSKSGETVYVTEDTSEDEDLTDQEEVLDYANWQLWLKVFTE